MRPHSRIARNTTVLGALSMSSVAISGCKWNDVLLQAQDGGTSQPDSGSSTCTNRELPDASSGLAERLIAWYPCESASSTAESTLVDASGHDHDGSLVAAGEGTGYTFAAGKVGNALNLLLAEKGYVNLPAGLLADACEFTIATWVYINSNVNAWTRLWDFGQDTNTYMFFTPITNTDNVARFAISLNGNTHEEIIKAQTEVPTLKWVHVAVVVGANGGTVYFDGEPVGANSAITLRPADLGRTSKNYIGRSEFADDPYLDAAIDEFRIYDRALSSEEVKALVSSN